MSNIFNINKKPTIIGVMIVAILFAWFISSNYNNSLDVPEGKIEDIKTMIQLCTVEVYNEVVILDTINNKVICGKQKQRGSISFDLENIELDNDGDTVIFRLPPEIVVVRESTEPNSWEVIDTKNLAFWGFDNMNIYDENEIKTKAIIRSKQDMYQNGIVERARSEGKKNLERFMKMIYRKPVKVIDETPEGAHFSEYQ